MKMDWFKLWVEDKESIINTMVRNMTADLEAGYSYFGQSMVRARQELADYKAKYDADLDKIADMEPNKVQHWCYIQLLKAGAITP